MGLPHRCSRLPAGDRSARPDRLGLINNNNNSRRDTKHNQESKELHKHRAGWHQHLHLKHLGPHSIQALTNIANFSYAHCRIPTIWKHGTIITILKPNKNFTIPSSYRPITLLSTPSKIAERLILSKITPNVPLAPSQHGFQALHSTNTLLTNLTQHASDGINSAKPAHRTLLNNNKH